MILQDPGRILGKNIQEVKRGEDYVDPSEKIRNLVVGQLSKLFKTIKAEHQCKRTMEGLVTWQAFYVKALNPLARWWQDQGQFVPRSWLAWKVKHFSPPFKNSDRISGKFPLFARLVEKMPLSTLVF